MIAVTDQDWKIIDVLKSDSRMAIREIAKKTKLRPSTVHNRIQKMKENGIIEKFTLKLDNSKANENFIVFLFVLTAKNIENTKFKDFRIKEVLGVTGDYDLLLKCKFKDIVEFNEFLIQFRDNNPITKTLSMISTCTLKEEL